MLGAVEAPHPAVGFGPNNEVERVEAELRRYREYGRVAAPVAERAEDPAFAETRQGGLHPGLVEAEELAVRHLARSHRELAMGSTSHMASNPDVVGLVGQDEANPLVAIRQEAQDLCVGCVAADDAVSPQPEHIAESGDRPAPGGQLYEVGLGFWLQLTRMQITATIVRA
jgi:hypothetical protein